MYNNEEDKTLNDINTGIYSGVVIEVVTSPKGGWGEMIVEIIENATSGKKDTVAFGIWVERYSHVKPGDVVVITAKASSRSFARKDGSGNSWFTSLRVTKCRVFSEHKSHPQQKTFPKTDSFAGSFGDVTEDSDGLPF